MTPVRPPGCNGSGLVFERPASGSTAAAWELTPGFQVHAGKHPQLIHAFNRIFSSFQAQPGPSPSLSLEMTESPSGGGRLFINGVPMFSWESAAALLPLLESVFTDYAIHGRPHDLAFHASALEINGIGVLLSGGKGCGKSTLSLWLAQHGAQYGGDEVVFLDIEQGRMEGFPKAATIKEPAPRRMGRLPRSAGKSASGAADRICAQYQPRDAPVPGTPAGRERVGRHGARRAQGGSAAECSVRGGGPAGHDRPRPADPRSGPGAGGRAPFDETRLPVREGAAGPPSPVATVASGQRDHG